MRSPTAGFGPTCTWADGHRTPVLTRPGGSSSYDGPGRAGPPRGTAAAAGHDEGRCHQDVRTRSQETVNLVDEPARTGVRYGDVADFVYILLTLAFFALAALLVGVLDRRLGR